MTRRRTSITVDQEKLDQAVQITGATSASGAIDIALDRLVRAEFLRRDITAYSSSPPTLEEIALAEVAQVWDDLADETDWLAVYSDPE